MDPQERLFLQSVYEAIEDAGYTRESIATSFPRKGEINHGNRAIGVYVGVMYQEYQLYGAQAQSKGVPIALSGNSSAIANRVSYYFDFHGPSMTVDTMCSSSLTSIHLACESIKVVNVRSPLLVVLMLVFILISI
nr:beta-ketoacyl synthase N-terminal-like domain-containing protein [Bacillus velezensis]